MSLEHVRVSQKARDQLITLKRYTGIAQWNILCRWALCASLAEETIPPHTEIALDSNVEMTWQVFGGEFADVYRAAIAERCARDGFPTDADTLNTQFQLHLHRGIAYLVGDRDRRTLSSLVRPLVEAKA